MDTEPTEQDREQARTIVDRALGEHNAQSMLARELIAVFATALHEREEQARADVWKRAIAIASGDLKRRLEAAAQPKDES